MLVPAGAMDRYKAALSIGGNHGLDKAVFGWRGNEAFNH